VLRSVSDIEQAVNSAAAPTDHTAEPICTHDASNDEDSPKEGPFGGLSDVKNFYGEYPFPKNFKGHFTCKLKSRITFDR
jgi:hypothetical protein